MWAREPSRIFTSSSRASGFLWPVTCRDVPGDYGVERRNMEHGSRSDVALAHFNDAQLVPFEEDVRTIDSNLGPDPAHLHPLVAAKLGDFIDSFNVYVLGDPRALNLDRIRLGPQDRQAARRIVALAAPIARAAGEPDSPVTPAAQEALSEQVDAAIDAPNDINGDQSAELAGKTTGNFISELLRGAYAQIRKSGAAIRDGLYREAGAHAFRYFVDGDHWPEISSFVVHNADALRAFVKGGFQNPK